MSAIRLLPVAEASLKLAQRLLQSLAEMSGGRQLRLIAEAAAETPWHRTARPWPADQVPWYAIAFEPLVQPFRPAGVGVAIADERAVSEGLRGRHGRQDDRRKRDAGAGAHCGVTVAPCVDAAGDRDVPPPQGRGGAATSSGASSDS